MPGDILRTMTVFGPVCLLFGVAVWDMSLFQYFQSENCAKAYNQVPGDTFNRSVSADCDKQDEQGFMFGSISWPTDLGLFPCAELIELLGRIGQEEAFIPAGSQATLI